MANSNIPSSQDSHEGLSHEYKELLSTLPIEKGWRTSHLYQYQGFWCTHEDLPGIMACQKHFEARDSDLLLVSLPKSGTIWLKALIFSLVNRTRYPFSQHPLLTTNPHDLIPFFELMLYTNKQIPDLTSFPSPQLFATHIPYALLPGSLKDSDCRMVYLCRNPRDTFVSYWHFINKLNPDTHEALSLEEALELFCCGVSKFGPFWEHALGFWKESLERPHKVLFLKYEDKMGDPKCQFKKMGEFLGYPFSINEENQGVVDEILKLCSFETLRYLEVNKTQRSMGKFDNNTFFRRGKVGDWVNYLTPKMIERVDQVMEERLHGSGFTFHM